MEIQIAEEFERIVAVIDTHPVAAFAAGLFIIVLSCIRKDGPATRFLDLLTEKSKHNTALELRRLELMKMIDQRIEPELPGFGYEEDQQKP